MSLNYKETVDMLEDYFLACQEIFYDREEQAKLEYLLNNCIKVLKQNIEYRKHVN